MISRAILVLFVAPFIICTNEVIDANTLHAVFGYPSQYAVTPGLAQAQAVVPATDALTDPDYWDVPTAAVPDYDKFDWTLTKRVASSSEANFLLSPLGLKLALAILVEAATGQTQSELSLVLGLGMDRNLRRQKFSTIIESLQRQSPQYILDLGSRIFVDDSANIRQQFAAIAQTFYNTELKTIDFHKAPVAAQSINNWVANVTHGKITDLVDPDDIENAVVLILNTLYFKGSWRHQFTPNATKTGQFYVTPKLQKPVSYMNVKDKFYFTESKRYDAKILRLPYLGNKYAMYIIVPNSLSGLPHVLDGISLLRSEIDSLRERVVDVTLPKFKFDYTSQLDGVLKELGVRQAFEDSASFPGIARGQTLAQRLKVSKVLQRSGIDVNELGSIAYTATEIALVNKFGEDDEANVEVTANKPFLFFIQDDSTRQLLFTGRVADPSQIDGAFKLE